MAVQKTLIFPGGLTVAAYVVIGAVKRNRITGQIDFDIVAYRDEARRREVEQVATDYHRATAALAAARGEYATRNQIAAATPEEQNAKELALVDIQRRLLTADQTMRALAVKAQSPDFAPLHVFPTVSVDGDNAADMLDGGGSADLAKLYAYAKQPGFPLADGTDC